MGRDGGQGRGGKEREGERGGKRRGEDVRGDEGRRGERREERGGKGKEEKRRGREGKGEKGGKIPLSCLCLSGGIHPHDLITSQKSHFLTPSHWFLGIQHRKFRGPSNQSITPLMCRKEQIKGKHSIFHGLISSSIGF